MRLRLLNRRPLRPRKIRCFIRESDKPQPAASDSTLSELVNERAHTVRVAQPASARSSMLSPPKRAAWFTRTELTAHVGAGADARLYPRVGIDHAHFSPMSLNRCRLRLSSHLLCCSPVETPCGIKNEPLSPGSLFLCRLTTTHAGLSVVVAHGLTHAPFYRGCAPARKSGGLETLTNCAESDTVILFPQVKGIRPRRPARTPWPVPQAPCDSFPQSGVAADPSRRAQLGCECASLRGTGYAGRPAARG